MSVSHWWTQREIRKTIHGPQRTHSEFGGGLNSINMVISRPARTAACVPTVTGMKKKRNWNDVYERGETGHSLRKCIEKMTFSSLGRNSLMLEWCKLNSFSFKAVACCRKALCNCNLSAANILEQSYVY